MRLHQAAFRELVLGAYGRRCAISNLPIEPLLEAAHIIADHDERGLPEAANGNYRSRLHHSAWDCNPLGIEPDGVVCIFRSAGETGGSHISRRRDRRGGRILPSIPGRA